MPKKVDWEKIQVKEQEETNYILVINTIATIIGAIGGLASLYIAYVAFKLSVGQ